jgi:signal peptidase II
VSSDPSASDGAGDEPSSSEEPVAVEPSPEPGHPRAPAVAAAIVAVVVALDQLTKSYVESVLTAGEFVPWLGARVGWQLVYNPGGAFGIPAPYWIFLVVTVVVVVVVVRALPHTSSLLQAASYALLLAGALGNAVDRLFRAGAVDGPRFGGGYVVDFVAWGSFPRFNVADSAITVGFTLLVLALVLEERRHRSATEPDDGPATA